MIKGFGGSSKDTLENIADCVAAVSAAVSAGMQIATEFAKAESEIQLKAVEKRYDREISLAEGNSYKVKKLEKQKEIETAKIKNEASRKEFQMKVVQALAQSVVAGLNAYTSTLAIPVVGPALAPAAMAVALAMGATQVALLRKQQQAAEAQGYSKGGFTKPGGVDEPAGIVHAGEWVASQKLLASPVARPMIEALDYAQRTNTIGTLRADDVSRMITAPAVLASRQTPPATVVNNTYNAAPAPESSELTDTIRRLSDRLNEPIVAISTVTGEYGSLRAEDEYNRLIRNKSPKSHKK